MNDGIGKLRARLLNWGVWLNWEAEIVPDGARCVSLESRHIPDSGDVWNDADEPTLPTPNVSDAETMESHIRQLEWIQQYCLAVTYGGMPCVFRFRRIGEQVMAHQLELAELLLYESLKRRA
jgi:hypothetical protein